MMVEVVPALVLYCIIYMMSINNSPPCLFCDGLVARSLGSWVPRNLVLANMARERGYAWTYLRRVRLSVSEAARPRRVSSVLDDTRISEPPVFPIIRYPCFTDASIIRLPSFAYDYTVPVFHGCTDYTVTVFRVSIIRYPCFTDASIIRLPSFTYR